MVPGDDMPALRPIDQKYDADIIEAMATARLKNKFQDGSVQFWKVTVTMWFDHCDDTVAVSVVYDTAVVCQREPWDDFPSPETVAKLRLLTLL